MTYATLENLIDRFGEKALIELTDRTNVPVTTIDTDVVDSALADADALIDSYVGKKYDLPLATVPPILVRYASDIARFYLYGERAGKDHPVRSAFDLAHDWLKDVARGLVKLDDGTGEDVPVEGGADIRTDAPDRVMSRDSLEGY